MSERIIARDKLTTLMVTHSMRQAATLGDRLIMMYQGRIIHDFEGAEKRRLRPDDLPAKFESVRPGELLDAGRGGDATSLPLHPVHCRSAALQ